MLAVHNVCNIAIRINVCITCGADSSPLSPSAIYLLLLDFAKVPLTVLTYPRCNPKT